MASESEYCCAIFCLPPSIYRFNFRVELCLTQREGVETVMLSAPTPPLLYSVKLRWLCLCVVFVGWDGLNGVWCLLFVGVLIFTFCFSTCYCPENCHYGVDPLVFLHGHVSDLPL